jgi:hypothetical protein
VRIREARPVVKEAAGKLGRTKFCRAICAARSIEG